jgi:AbiV family abortive infection protein
VTDKEERENYTQIFENGVKHITAAKEFGKKEMYGFAISHFVLGAEELIKYYVVMNQLVDNTLFQEADPSKKGNIFRRHRTKHKLIREFQEAISERFAEKHIQTVFLREIGRPLDSEQEETLKNRFRHFGSFLALAFGENNLSDEDRKDFLAWLSKANESKNNGFYVDNRNGIFVGPNNISKEEYQQALKHITFLLKSIEKARDLDHTEDEFIDMMN